MKLDDLEFIVTLPSQNWTRGQERLELVQLNIFTDAVKVEIAKDIAMLWKYDNKPDKLTKNERYSVNRYLDYDADQRLFYYFHFCWGRVQWEMNISRAFETEPSQKICVYDLYLRPNRDLLLQMIDQVDIKSAKAYYNRWKREQRART